MICGLLSWLSGLEELWGLRRTCLGFVLWCSLGCVWLQRAVRWCGVENVGRIKHILWTVTLCHKPSLKSLAQPAGEEGRIPCCSQQGKVGCFCFPVTPVTNSSPSTKCLWLCRQNAKPNCYVQPVRIFPVRDKKCHFLQIMTFCGNISISVLFHSNKSWWARSILLKLEHFEFSLGSCSLNSLSI